MLILVAIALIHKSGKKEPASENNQPEQKAFDFEIFNRSVKVKTVYSNRIVVELAVPKVNEAGLAEPDYQEHTVLLGEKTVILNQSASGGTGPGKVSDMKAGDTITVETQQDMLSPGDQEATKIIIQ